MSAGSTISVGFLSCFLLNQFRKTARMVVEVMDGTG